FFPPTHIQSKLAEQWCQEVEKQTNGEVTIKYFPAGALAKPTKIYDAVDMGIIDIGFEVLSYVKGRFPLLAAIDLPWGYTSGVQATKVANGVVKEFDPKELHDTQLMFVHAHGPGLIHTRKKAINNMADLKGLKLRGTGASALIQQALGATPVAAPMSKTYEMLQKGVVDGSSHPLESNNGWKLGEVVNYVVENYSTAYTTTFGVFMNKAKWDKISPKSQKIITALNEKFAAKHGEAWDASDEAGLAAFKKHGGKIISQSDETSARWAEAVQPLFASYEKKVKAKGIDGQKIINFIKKEMK
ncbi:MAG: TRAP transporter substrate-binding protein, partial [Desulfobacteraceae bacterium]|nr:TRAP transporter substrate-binding protein [Desulfobacteraceae bacterium]